MQKISKDMYYLRSGTDRSEYHSDPHERRICIASVVRPHRQRLWKRLHWFMDLIRMFLLQD